MTLTPLDVLKNGLKLLQRRVKARKEEIQARLAEKKSISSQDEEWLDGEANLIDEQQVLDALDDASDYERGFGRLNDVQKGVVRKLQEVAGNLTKTAGKKRKHACSCDFQIALKTIDKSKGPENKPVKVSLSSSNKEPAGPVFTKKENATLGQRIEILNWYHANGKNQSKTAKHFDQLYPNLKIKQPLVSAWVKDEAKWRDEWAHTSVQTHSAKRICQTQHPEVSEMLDLWVSKAMADNLLVTGEVLRQKWTKFADLARVPEDERLSLSEGWLACVKNRNGLKQLKRHGEGGSVDLERVEGERRRIQGLIKEYGYELKDIFNMDETGLFYGYHNIHLFSFAPITHVENRMPSD